MVLRFPTKASLIPVLASAVLCFAAAETGVASSGGKSTKVPHIKPRWTSAVAFDVSAPLRDMATTARVGKPVAEELKEIREERVLRAFRDLGHTPDGALQGPAGSCIAPALAIPSTLANFRRPEQPGQLQHLRLPRQSARSGRRRRPEPLRRNGQPRLRRLRQARQPAPRPGRHRHTVGRASRSRTAPTRRATRSCSTTSSRSLAAHPVHDARPGRSDAALLQLRRDLQTGDPTGAYYRYAFITQPTESTAAPSSPTTPSTASGRTRTSSPPATSGWSTEYGISVYALEKNKMIAGNPKRARSSSSSTRTSCRSTLIGDGLLPADIDGNEQPRTEPRPDRRHAGRRRGTVPRSTP